MRAYVANWLYVPLRECGALPAIKKELTVKRVWFDRTKPKPQPIPNYDESVNGYLGVPIDWGMQRFPHIEIEDRTSKGKRIRVKRLPDPHHPKAGDGQAEFMEGLLEGSLDYYAFMGKAGTGTGKTVSALWLSGTLQRSTLIIVPSEQLAAQWRKEIKLHLGVPDEHIGTIQQDTCEYDRPFVIAVVHTLVRREYGMRVRTAFGIVVWDEVHRMGAFTFSRSLGIFHASVKLAMTATVKRKDGSDKVYLQYFGPPAVDAKENALPMRVRVLRYSATKVWGNNRAAQVMCLTFDKTRNQKIVKLVANAWERGRYILVISEKIKHLQDLRVMLIRAGVPAEVMGQFTASYYPKTDKGKWSDRSKKTKPGDLDRIKEDESIEIVFATFASFKEGQDIPRLDWGIDVTPRVDGAQAIGRLRRKYKGKPLPVWYTIIDVAMRRFVEYATQRIEDYESTGNVEVIDNGQREKEQA